MVFTLRSTTISSSTLPLNFLGLPPELANYENSKVVILPVPYDSTTSYRAGTREGPVAIIQASRFLEYFDPELRRDFTTLGIATLPVLSPEMSGPQQMVDRIYQETKRLLRDGKFVVMLGGEHSLSSGSVRAFVEKFPKLGVLQIDAHLDLRDSYDGTPYNHACAMRRIWEMCPIVQVGMRSVDESEDEFVEAQKLHPYYSWTIRKNKNWQREVVEKLPEEVYITVDLDGLDPSIMPAVGTPEPDGLLWHEVMNLFRCLADRHKIVGFDVVELNPIPGLIAPDYLASKLVYRMIGLAEYSLGKTKLRHKSVRKG